MIIVGPMLVAWQWSDTIYLSVVFQTRSSMLNQVFVGVYPWEDVRGDAHV